jgi:hypothetical protein
VIPTLQLARIALAVVGLALFGWGVRVDEPRWRLVGIACLAVSLRLRWWRRSPPSTPAE